MDAVFGSLELLVLNCLFVTAELPTGKILPPQNLSVLWISDFEPLLTWEPPQLPLTNCTYNVCTDRGDHSSTECQPVKISEYGKHFLMQGGVLRWEVKIVCGGKESEVAHYNVNYTELVTDLNCYSSTARQAHCSWSPASNATDLSFFYLLVDETPNGAPPSQLKECSSYINTGGVKTGCDLQATTQEAIHILLNGTLNNTTVRNTFTFETINDVKPPPLIWKVTKNGTKLNISWTPPDVLSQDCWEFNINYTECGKIKSFIIKQEVTSHLMNWVPHCEYCIAIRALSSEGNTPWSDQKCFGADVNWSVYAAVIIPLVIACLAALTFKCYWKNKEKIFPKVPKPRDLLTDISDNNNESTRCNMYIPAEEEENCKITLLTDTQISSLDCSDFSDISSLHQ
ncbi:uncharacterized protein PAE49_021817 [Odontesthes bonariensis]|uniref:uncharacterized protein LOC142368528 n=1 Tax=Odontesthes bonariensis TaxID=219752 RepID=UPI003F587E42